MSEEEDVYGRGKGERGVRERDRERERDGWDQGGEQERGRKRQSLLCLLFLMAVLES